MLTPEIDALIAYQIECERIKKYGTKAKPQGADCFRDDITPTPGGCNRAGAELSAWASIKGIAVNGLINYWTYRK